MISRSRPLPSFAVLLLAIVPLAAQQLPKPQAEHRKLAESVGTWDAVIESVGLDGARHTSRGTSVQTMGPGGFWLVEDFRGEMNGLPFTGQGALGYDPQQKVFVRSWISMSPLLMVSTGTFDAAGKVLTMTGPGPSVDGTPLTMKVVTTWTSADARTLDVFVVLPGGTEQKSMTITYSRRAEPRSGDAGRTK